MKRDHGSLILASTSPRRQTIMSWLGLAFVAVASDVDESRFDHLEPVDQALTLARTKAETVAALRPDSVVIAADTVVELDGESLGKPLNDEGAARMLRRLSERTHRVITGVAVHRDGRTVAVSMTTEVTMRPIREDELMAYVATGEPLDKAGGYAIQGLAGSFVKAVEGCHLNVVGFPVCVVDSLLRGRTDAPTPDSIELCSRTWEAMAEQQIFDPQPSV
ncbi:MAG TPA: Maf family protein [Chloroflexota bacterium]|nr:Maf family protein [Chloroflexota bacterium]